MVSACAVFFLVLGQAVRGEPWAIVVSTAAISLLVLLLFHAAVYLATLTVASWITAKQSPARTSRGGVQTTPTQQTPPT